MGPIDCPETSVTNHQTTLSNIPEEQRPHFHVGASLRARIIINCKCFNLRVKLAGSILQGGRLTNKLNSLNAELNPICHLLALLGAHHVFHVSGLRVKIQLLLDLKFQL